MLTNDQLDQWDRAHFMHPSTHLAEFARGEAPARIVTVPGSSPCQVAAMGFSEARGAVVPRANGLQGSSDSGCALGPRGGSGR